MLNVIGISILVQELEAELVICILEQLFLQQTQIHLKMDHKFTIHDQINKGDEVGEITTNTSAKHA